MPVVRWKDRVKEEYMHERVADRGGGRGGGSSAVAITLGDFSFLVDICDESIDFFFFYVCDVMVPLYILSPVVSSCH